MGKKRNLNKDERAQLFAAAEEKYLLPMVIKETREPHWKAGCQASTTTT